jgi:hypothetical protein
MVSISFSFGCKVVLLLDVKKYGESRGTPPPVLKLHFRWRTVDSFTLCCFTHRDIAPGTQAVRWWVGSRAVLGALRKRKIFFTCQESNHDSSVV